MDFGFTLKPDHTLERTIALAQQAEAGGFSYGWLFDSHVLWKDPYPLLTVMALNTTEAAPRARASRTRPRASRASPPAPSRRSTRSAAAGWSWASAVATPRDG